jgi:hypothetical protein
MQFWILGLWMNACLFCETPAWAGPIITVTNSSDTKNQILSDLIVFGNNQGERRVLLKPGDNGGLIVDNITLGPRQGVIFEAGFEITKYEISEPTSPTQDRATTVFTQLTGKRVTLIDDPSGVNSVFLSIDFAQFDFAPPEEGSMLGFIGGMNPATPGWFVGTNLNFDTGDISGPFTGSVLVTNSDFFALTTVPEPSSLALSGAGALALLAYGWWHRRREYRA